MTKWIDSAVLEVPLPIDDDVLDRLKDPSELAQFVSRLAMEYGMPVTGQELQDAEMYIMENAPLQEPVKPEMVLPTDHEPACKGIVTHQVFKLAEREGVYPEHIRSHWPCAACAAQIKDFEGE